MGENAEYEDGTTQGCFSSPDVVTGDHDWRLISEETTRLREDDGRANFTRRWYCTRCRLVEDWTSE